MMGGRQSGYIALISILVIGAISTAVALVLLATGADAQRGSLATQRSIQARSLANTCAEEALQRIHDNTGYTGTGNINLGTGSCSYTVTNTGGTSRSVAASGTVNNVVRRVQVYVTINASSISITSWQEVS
jgi:hypothetical protein